MSFLCTVKNPVRFEGVGLHSGKPCSVEINPLYVSRGIVFEIENRSYSLDEAELRGSGRGTELVFSDGAIVRTVEHLMAALYTRNIGQAVIRISGPEMPVLDGSSLAFSKKLKEVGVVETDCETVPFCPWVPIVETDNSKKKILCAFPSDSLSITYAIEYENPVIGTEIYDFRVTSEGFLEEIAPCRTFALEEEMDALRERGLARGGNLENAILVTPHEALNQKGLYFSNEFVRHKILDIIGDLALLGRPLHAHIVAIRTGHDMHLRLVRRLKRMLNRNE
ncbi:MAG: UDP-3-O-acyl-N-acetylglucosamine deacetylase [Aminobacterium sp.]|jgi:UDP-3-O-[3-hydroxymyristoyl] N-acetylglucosamine deacetylase|uniref:UDP-3-O-acyl-N-acetylglucosamine deacetylase n=1 Tax=unclassified Aminobacterium TaxID=2685012 RepID=UPI001BCD045F|nr:MULTISPECIES: UDP-3-O-acyl-N-acetylglucosamine deacetylase [unclassified Aminobacterium]MDD2207570.1 UDP-3-O-acyl-N-acetylglucosamine deacetylase [Aminobacterium sp.]MDD4228810.1 UDP-3-O-acyl-N-acetylglucosamine deacetylase [Aminobacterium sp.]MDD4550571.1 UDP-3-O-acyl-N-acetylglucosamine deacetylase [Aminobacterium sp.]MEA4876518.1 UDP-3-O-acyl-N-acetylglucosamine deacetylase [Aminobacterium sp.]WMI71951.1 UDP-3-O-acyl-N-acetylglucosamine deacetylase [Aminobacterium sp. MB27-C1]